MQIWSFILIAVIIHSKQSHAWNSQFFIDVDNNNISISNDDGQEVHIQTNKVEQLSGLNLISVEVSGPTYRKTFQFNDDVVSYDGKFESDILNDVFSRFNGYMDEKLFNSLLNTVADHVQKTQLEPIVFYALRTLIQGVNHNGVWYPGLVGQYGQNFWGMGNYFPYYVNPKYLNTKFPGHSPYNVNQPAWGYKPFYTPYLPGPYKWNGGGNMQTAPSSSNSQQQDPFQNPDFWDSKYFNDDKTE